MDTKPTPEKKLEFLQSRIRTMLSKEQRHLAEVNNSILAAAKDEGRDGPHCVVNPERRPHSPVEAAVEHMETQLLSSTRAFVYSFYLAKLQDLQTVRTVEETVQMVQRSLGFTLARKASEMVNRTVSWLKTGGAEAELAALGELQLLFLEAETGDTSGEVV